MWLRFAARSLARNPRRSVLTIGGLAIFLSLLCILFAVVGALDRMFADAGREPLLVTLHRSGWMHDLHETSRPKIEAIAGVVEVHEVVYFGGAYGDTQSASNTFVAAAIGDYDQRKFWHGEAEISAEDQDAFNAARDAALVGPETMKRFGWKKGQRVTLRGTARPVELTFTIVGTFAINTDRASFIFHRAYLEDAATERGAVTFYWVKVGSSADLPRVARQIDGMFAESDTPTRTIPFRQFMETALALVGNVRAIVGGVATLALIGMLLLMTNSIAMSVRERAGEIAVMRALGFGRRHAVGLVLLECVLTGIAGALIGCGLAWLALGGGFSMGFALVSGFRVEPSAVAWCVVLAALLSGIAGLAPAMRIARIPIIEGLRRFD
jgi:putative ABC transport system permease protein